jgi:hypothetical protein
MPLMWLEQTGPTHAHGLSTAGWIFISCAWIAIIGVAVFCYSRVIRLAEQRKRASASAAPSEPAGA